MKARIVFALCALVAAAAWMSVPAASWLVDYTVPSGGGAPQPDHWDFSAFPVQWNLNPSTGANITGTGTVASVIQSSFNTWTSAPGASVQISRGTDTTTTSSGFSSTGGNTNLVCFVCQGDFTKDAQTLAVTITTVENSVGASNGHGGKSTFAGQILDADILFNPSTTFDTGGGSGQDLQTVATHEIGHFLGLDHSGVVRAMMFPFAPSLETTLGYDDVAAISTIYPGGGSGGIISGSVTFAGSGGPVYGAHVFAQSVTANMPIGGSIRKTPIGTLSLPDGSYRIAGVPPDSYIVVAEPLDLPVNSSNVPGYTQACGNSITTNFTTRWH